MGEGVRRVVYCLRKVSSSAVEAEGGKLIRRPGSPFPGDCRGCSFIDLVCEELDHPCPGVYHTCERSEGGRKV